jgi:hypothetical protein
MNRIIVYLYRCELTLLPTAYVNLFSLSTEKNTMDAAVWNE